MANWDMLASDEQIEKTIKALKQNGIQASVVDNAEAAKAKAAELVPEGAEVFTLSSVSLQDTGITALIDESGKYTSVRQQLDKLEDTNAKRKLGAAPEYAIGSVHAVTLDGEVLIASNTGSQLPADVYGAGKVIWVVGTQKIVPNQEAGMKRIQEYILPLESARLSKLYGKEISSNVSKLLIISRELQAERIQIIFVKAKLGF